LRAIRGAATTSIGGELGSYTLATSTEPATFSGCPAVHNQWFVAQNVSTTQTLDAGDCRAVTSPAGTYFEDRVRIWMQAGTTYVIDQTSTVVDAFLELYLNGQPVASNDNGGGGTNARITFTPPAQTAGFYEIRASTRVQFQGGGYTLTIR
jgi:hypothetical protein